MNVKRKSGEGAEPVTSVFGIDLLPKSCLTFLAKHRVLQDLGQRQHAFAIKQALGKTSSGVEKFDVKTLKAGGIEGTAAVMGAVKDHEIDEAQITKPAVFADCQRKRQV